MLSAPYKSQRKRRRRKKQIVQNASTTIPSAQDDRNSKSKPIDSTELAQELSAQEQPLFPRLNKNFLSHEADIEANMLLKKFNEDTDVSKRKECEIAFFTNNIGDDAPVAPEAEMPRAEGDNDAEIDVLPTPSTVRVSYPEEGPQFASSYFNGNDRPLIEPCPRNLIEFDQQLLFLPAIQETTTKEDVEATAATSSSASKRDPMEEGLFLHEEPILVRRNHQQMINRLLEENAMHWLAPDNDKMIHMVSFLSDRRSFKSDANGRKISVISYPITSVEATSAASAMGLQDRTLKVCVQSLFFERHPIYNEEQLIARNVEHLFNQYAMRRQNDVVAGLRIKLDVQRKLIISNAPTHGTAHGDANARTGEQIDTSCHRDELRVLRNSLHREEKTDRDIVRGLLQAWRTLKEVREKYKTPKTNLRLIIKAHDVDAATDEIDWNYRFNLELNEIYEEAMEFYRRERELQKISIDADTEANNGNFEQIHKSRRPDLDEIRQQLLDIYSNSVRPPGEQILDFELIRSDNKISNTNVDERIDALRYRVAIMLDDQEVGSTKSVRMDQNGRAFISELFTIRLVSKIPENIQIMIYERKSILNETKVAEIYPPIPFETELYSRTLPLQMSFSSTVSKHTGSLTLLIGWTASDDATARMQQNQDTRRTARHKFKWNQTKMCQIIQRWYDEYLIDPMDPDNRDLIAYIQSGHRGTDDSLDDQKMATISQHADKQFNINEDVTAFCSRDKLDNDKRLNLLIARFNSDLKLKNCRLVPHTEIEIELSDDLKIFEDVFWVDPIDVQRYQGKTYLKHVYDIITNHCESMNREYNCHDLLIGDTPPTFLGVMEAISNIFSPRRPLHPKRRTTMATQRFAKYPTMTHVDRFNIVLNVARASGIPYRNIDEQAQVRRISAGSAFQNIHRPANVRPFISVTFKDKHARTSTVEGCNPTWNEQIVISVYEDINQIKSSLSILMFDEVIEDITTSSDATSGNSIFQKFYNKFLGELIIPFSTIYTSRRIEGTFEMTTPHILLGYTKPSVTLPDQNYLNTSGKLEIRQSILVSLLISIEPVIHLPYSTTSQLECTELSSVKKQTRRWYEEMREEFPDRCQDPLVSLANGKRVCLTRLIGPIDIPFERGDASEYLIRRFVSLIPVRPHKNICTKLNGVWLTNDQMLHTLVASPKDLGVLLTCYYLSLGYASSFLVLGYAIPYGDTTFVLVKDNTEYHLIDPHSGKKYSSRDTFCPLTRVYALANNENIWANIQREHRVYMMSFDVGFSTEWRECFSRSSPAPAELVHNLQLIYTDSMDHTNLRKTIELKIMKKIIQWRGAKKTMWNTNLKEPMLRILRDLEEDRCFEYDTKNYLEHLNASVVSKYKISGFPLNMPYVNVARILDRVKATGIHIQTDDRVEFSIVVHIQPYPMNVLSVWVFIVALTPLSVN